MADVREDACSGEDLAWFGVTASTDVTGQVQATVVARSAPDAMVVLGDELRRHYGVDHLGEGDQDWSAVRLPGSPGRPAGVVRWGTSSRAAEQAAHLAEGADAWVGRGGQP